MCNGESCLTVWWLGWSESCDGLVRMACHAIRVLGREVLGIGFEAYTAGCSGAAVTDGLLALHSLSGAGRISASGSGALARTATAWTLLNAAWSASGALMWLLPSQSSWFEPAWRCNALVLCAFLFCSWLVVSASLSALGCGEQASRGVHCIGLAHAVAFGASTLPPAACQEFEGYVMLAGSNLALPLVTLIVL